MKTANFPVAFANPAPAASPAKQDAPKAPQQATNTDKPATSGTAPGAPDNSTVATETGAKESKTRVAPEMTAVRSDIAPPTVRNNRGSKSSYDFDKLTAVGMSFGIKNKDAKAMASIVSNQNKKFLEPKKDENGNTIFKMQEMKDANGNVTQVPTSEAETIATRHFFAHNVDPKTDPDGASVRIWRDK